MIIRNRGYLPHIEPSEATYFVTFRLAQSIPTKLLQAWQQEKDEILRNAKKQKRKLSKYELRRLSYLQLERIEKYLDLGIGECWLANPEVAKLTSDALEYFDGTRYLLHAWCVMPNHVHALFSPIRQTHQLARDSLLIPILHTWKSYTATKANQLLKRAGKFWQEDYYDTIVRSDRQFAFYVLYTLQNPVKAGLCKQWQDWPWSGCSQELKNKVDEEVRGLEVRVPTYYES